MVRPYQQQEEETEMPLIYNLVDDDENDEDDFIRELTLNEYLIATLGRRSTSGPADTLKAATTDSGVTIEIGSCVELVEEEFVLVKELFSGRSGEVFIKGTLFVRTEDVMNMLPKNSNEVCAVLKARADTGGTLPELYEYPIIRPLSSVICTRTLILTNQPFPIHSFYENGVGYNNPSTAVEDTAELVCRHKHIVFCDTVKYKVSSEAVVRLKRNECSVGIADTRLMRDWRTVKNKTTFRRNIQKFTSNFTKAKKRTSYDLTADDEIEEVTSKVEQTYKRRRANGIYEHRSSSTVTKRFTPADSRRELDTPTTAKVYTFGDICAGAGGATTAAKRAGFLINFAVDHWDDACATLRKNFPDTQVYEMEIFEFCNKTEYMLVDVLHISFPCQPYSTAHTCAEGKDDDKNIAAGYSVIPLLQKCRPRIVTFEQSPNITKGKHRPSFEALIHQITEVGYSVRWKIVNFADTGNVQSRNRLFIIAACPGQPLPAFPKSTHGDGNAGLQRRTTVNDILSQVPRDLQPHMAETQSWRNERVPMPYNGNRPLRDCITTNGGKGNLHPNGKRSFNNQERAQLQGFPASHQFEGRKCSIMRQIGNAVPAIPATPFFEEVLKALKEFDKIVEAEKNEIIEIE